MFELGNNGNTFCVYSLNYLLLLGLSFVLFKLVDENYVCYMLCPIGGAYLEEFYLTYFAPK
jgi:hypothetical protein